MKESLKNYTDIKLNNLIIKWEEYPFPHAIIDNFLPEETFLKIIDSIEKKNKFEDIKKNFSTYIESNKQVYGDKDLNEILKFPITLLGGEKIKKIFKDFFNIKKIISLTDFPNYGGYYPFHIMRNKGLLGSHVDHSHSDSGELHIANAIYYTSKYWEESWGGETLLLNNNGTKVIKKIKFIPNRLVLFIHSAKSFHAVNKICAPDEIKRNTYYMDYYTDNENKELILNKKNLFYCYHLTTFVPFFPLGFKSFKFSNIFNLSTYKYLYIYLKYLISRFLRLQKKISI